MNALAWIEKWFADQCNGEWEHSNGLSIRTIDNPGWLVTVELSGTSLEMAANDELLGTTPSESAANGNIGGSEWMQCRIAGRRFSGAGDPGKLAAILDAFRDWVVAHGGT